MSSKSDKVKSLFPVSVPGTFIQQNAVVNTCLVEQTHLCCENFEKLYSAAVVAVAPKILTVNPVKHTHLSVL